MIAACLVGGDCTHLGSLYYVVYKKIIDQPLASLGIDKLRGTTW